MRALNVIASEPVTRVADGRIAADHRFSLALTNAVPLSMQGRPRASAASPKSSGGWLGPAASVAWKDRQAARSSPRGLIARAVTAPSSEVSGLVGGAVDAAVEAEVLAASLQQRDLAEARAHADQRALHICNSPRRC